MNRPADNDLEASESLLDGKPTSSRRGYVTGLLTRKILITFICFAAVVVFISQNGHLLVLDYAREKLARPPHPALDLLFPLATPDDERNWEDLNARTMQALMTCLATNTCGENQASVVVLASFHFGHSVEGHVSGEDIWAASVRDTLRGLGYSFLYSSNLESAKSQYRMFPDLVKVVLAEGADAKRCFDDRKCVKNDKNPLGIPIWKIFSFHFWSSEMHPLGRPWTLSPEDYRNGNQYLGYSLEDKCMNLTFVPHDERQDQVYILAKKLSYFYDKNYPWAPDALSRIEAGTGLLLVGGYKNDTESEQDPDGVINLGQLDKATFFDHLSHSRVLLGIVSPWLSPSPYDALCFGVPFINPIVSWNKVDPRDRTSWHTQHNGLKFIEEPYVYHVFKGDTDGLVRAVLAAKEHPIDRFIPREMTEIALVERVSYLVEHDWRSDAEELLANRTASGQGTSFVLRRQWCMFGRWAKRRTLML